VQRALIVGVEPEDVEDGIGLTPVVEAAVEPAVRRLMDIIHRVQAEQDTELSVLAKKES